MPMTTSFQISNTGDHLSGRILLSHDRMPEDSIQPHLPCRSTPMADSRSQPVRQSLHLVIDPRPYQPPIYIPPEPEPDSPSSANLEIPGTPSGGEFDSYITSVLCKFDFFSDDPDHLSFHKNEILDIVKKEDTGWWAAMRRDQDQVGWIPQAFVNPISDDMAEKLRKTREELRIYEYDAEQLYTSATTQPIQPLYEPTQVGSSPSTSKKHPDACLDAKAPSPQLYLPKNHSPEDLLRVPYTYQNSPSYNPVLESTQHSRTRPPPSPSTPVPQPPTTHPYNKAISPVWHNKDDTPQTRGRSESLPTFTNGKRPWTADDSRLSSLPENNGAGSPYNVISIGTMGGFDTPVKRTQSQKWKRVMGWDDSSVQLQSWFLQPTLEDQLEVVDGHVRWGTVDALVEKLILTADSIKTTEGASFRDIFLMTFRTFIPPDALFNMLNERFYMDSPESLTSAESEIWKKDRIIIQRRILSIFAMWLEDYRLLEEEPHIARRLSEFLDRILTPPLVSVAKDLMKTIERLTFASPNISSPVSPRKARKSHAHKGNLLKQDPVDIAEQLALLEFKRYAKVSPRECIQHPSLQNAPKNSNLSAFCSTHDMLVGWVKTSILTNDAPGKRADTIDFWIKVSEKCKNINNFASMSAIINALSSIVITRLHLTWAHVGRKSIFEGLLRYGEPTGGFSGYRSLLHNVEGPCVPFVGMFLTDIAHIHDQFNDENERICFLQRQRWYEVISTMLRYQARPYDIAESESTLNFIWRHLREDANSDANWFWSRSHEIQQEELAHADIRRGLEAAGF